MAPFVDRIPIRPGDRVRVELPHSEVCMYLRLAGKVRTIELVESGCSCGHAAHAHPYQSGPGVTWCDPCLADRCECSRYRPYCVAQILDEDAKPWSAPITCGEAGIFSGGPTGWYAYPAEVTMEVQS